MIVSRDVSQTIDPMDIKRFRIKHALSQSVAASLVEVATHTWQQWESGRRNINPTAWKLLQIFDTGKFPADFARIKEISRAGLSRLQPSAGSRMNNYPPGTRFAGVPEGLTPDHKFDGLTQWDWERYQKLQVDQGNLTDAQMDIMRDQRQERWERVRKE